MDLLQLAETITTEPTIAFLGAGASAELGLPPWKALAEIVLRAALPNISSAECALVQRAIDEAQYPRAFGTLERAVGMNRAKVIDLIRELASDVDQKGAIYSFAAKYPFKGYITTNFEGALLRHVRDALPGARSFTNSVEDLATVNLDLYPAVIHLHGRLYADGDAREATNELIVLTEDDYDHLVHGKDYGHINTFLLQMMRNRFLFLGYSIQDPDLQWMLQHLTHVYERKGPPHWAILPNVAPNEIADYRRRFNLQIITYRATAHDHSALVSLLRVLSEILPARDERTTPSVEISARERSLFMWMQTKDSAAERSNALQPLIVDHLASAYPEKVPTPDLTAAVKKRTGLSEEAFMKLFTESQDSLQQAGHLNFESGFNSLSPSSYELFSTQTRQHQNLNDAFREEVRANVGSSFGDIQDDGLKDRITNAVIASCIDVFDQAGSDMAASIIKGGRSESVAVRRSVLKVIYSRSEAFQDNNLDYRVSDFILRLLAWPGPISAPFLESLAYAYLASALLMADQDGITYRSEEMAQQCLIVDANVLISAAARNSERFKLVRPALQKASRLGFKLVTTRQFLDQVYGVAAAAADLVKRSGSIGRSLEVRNRATGDDGFAPNEYLQGWIETDDASTFQEYLVTCFGAPFQRDSVDHFVEIGLGVEVVAAEATYPDPAAYDSVFFSLAQKAVRGAGREYDPDKTKPRLESEIDTAILIHQLRRADAGTTYRVLSEGTYINSLAKSAPLNSPTNVCVTVQRLAALMMPLGEASELPLRQVLLSGQFSSFRLFVNPARVETFFSSLSGEAEAIYASIKSRFKELIDEEFESEWQQTLPSRRLEVLENRIAELERRIDDKEHAPAVGGDVALQRQIESLKEEMIAKDAAYKRHFRKKVLTRDDRITRQRRRRGR